ncbi:N-formylglutamate amidohydrolase [Porphyrobacter algicida]|uniref:N-formylglutamate amidohydrolase n=1 Tax=Qipengyuania algicida TaxID=1836209 RepID=A0A845AFR7_9SPHN|nr:N-formylglutamate amidohydrolase [Qipengyuania algicida]MXP29090.1 N-formylglutamate amidohydrolase [Qipengyuania algicida]
MHEPLQDDESDVEPRSRGDIPGGDGPAFSLELSDSLPLLIAVPHAGRAYPGAVLESMREPEWTAPRLEDRYADALGREIARLTGAPLLMAKAPRAMLDLNRAPDDIDWGMVTRHGTKTPTNSLANRRARSGLGLVPRRLPGVGELWKAPLPRDQLDARIAGIHRPYHRALSKVLENLRDRWGAALLLDLHSMPPLRPGPNDAKPAEFVLGDRFGASCDPILSALVLSEIGEAGRRIAHNRPYAGGYVLDCHAAPKRGIHALQLEVCRSTYLDARLERPGPRLGTVARLLAKTIRSLADEVARLGDGDTIRQAAE